MEDKRKVEVFSAGCPICEEAVSLVQEVVCSSCDVDVLEMNNPEVARRAEQLGVQSLPAVAVNGTLAECCTGRGITRDALEAEDIGQPLA